MAPDPADGATAPGPVRVLRPAGEPLPLVYDSPHSGDVMPDDFRPAVPEALLRRGEDRCVDELISDAPRFGIPVVAATFSRTYVDPNRAVDDLDASLLDGRWPGALAPGPGSRAGVGLVWRIVETGQPIHDRPLTVAEVRARIERWWRPYHDALERELDAAHARHGACWYVDWHSMWSIGGALSPDPGRARADFVLGDRDGAACEPAFTGAVRDALVALGYSVAINDPFAGAELVRRHGRPAERRHALQVEIRRGLFLDERTLAPGEGFARLREDLATLSEGLADWVRVRLRRR